MILDGYLLKLEDELESGVEGVILLGNGDEGFVASEAGFGSSAKESLQEVISQFLIGVAVRGGELVQHPKKMVDFVGVFVGDSSSTLVEKGGGPFSSSGGRRVVE